MQSDEVRADAEGHRQGEGAAAGTHGLQGLPVRQKSILERLREMILSGQVQPGEHLQEVPLSEQLGVSRTPIREALGALGQEGLVLYRPHRGYVVRSFTLEEILQAYTVRASLEGLACRLLAETGIDDATRLALSDCLAQGDTILQAGTLRDADLEPWRRMNDRFHQTVLHATRNRCLIDVTDRALAIPLVSSRVVHWFEFDRVKRSHNDHHVVFDAICERRGTRAEAAMREHIELATYIIRENHEQLAQQRHPLAAGD
ncbi:MAG: GntR family transcriptional regulator [Burkholderiaceae bacterium]|nr:GntR family transcriptional regulator [Burkholderiaceae bacterium]MDO9089174.1 GntR family transcriptional regulator [Burkholderiaceae bacterium]